MKIKHVELRGVLSHVESAIDFPEHGIVLVTGDNGAGKSAIYEGISYALFGESVRGEKIWNDAPDLDVKPSVRVLMQDGLDVLRSPRGLTFSGGVAGPPVKYETTGKAREALAVIVGDFQAWRMTSIFSPADMAAFSLATDGGRKEILETILGLARFDEAADAARADLRKCEASLTTLQNRVTTATAARAGLLRAMPADPPRPSVEVRAELDAARARKAAAVTRLDAAREVRKREGEAAVTANLQVSTLQADKARAHRAMEAALGGEPCETCGRPMPAGTPYAGAPVDEIDARLHVALRARTKAIKDVNAADDLIREINDTLSDATCAAEVLASELAQSLRYEKDSARVSSDVTALEEEIEELELVLAQKRITHDTITHAIKALRGVRGLLLSSALSALEGLVASYLAAIGDPYVVRIAADEGGRVSLSIVRQGTGRSYKAASQGERRRVDIAILLALGDLAAAARGVSSGILVLDECLDSLDTAGRAGVLRLIEQIADSRTVVVITHAKEIAAALPAVASYTVDRGTIARV